MPPTRGRRVSIHPQHVIPVKAKKTPLKSTEDKIWEYEDRVLAIIEKYLMGQQKTFQSRGL
jgi:hypothetical protein